MTFVRSLQAAGLVSLLTLTLSAQNDARSTSAPQNETQSPAPIVRRTPRPAPVTTPDQDKPAPVAKPSTPKAAPAKKLTTPAASPIAASATLPAGPFNRTTVFIDAAHGGNDSGSRINDSILEKDVVLQLAFKLRSLLTARGFNVVLTREDDAAAMPNAPGTPLTLDARAGMANHARPVACLLLHATGSGHGVHLYSSELAAAPAEPYAGPWLTAQAPWVAQSLQLEKEIGKALTRAAIPLVLSRASIRPVDSLTCPALVVELAPKSNDTLTLNDSGYQESVAQAIASTLLFWQNAAQPPSRLAPPTTSAASSSSPASTATTAPTAQKTGVQP